MQATIVSLFRPKDGRIAHRGDRAPCFAGRSAITGLIIVGSLGALSLSLSCSTAARGPLVATPFAETPAGEVVDGLRRRHGDSGRWEDSAAVEFRYRAASKKGQLRIHSIAFRRDDFSYLWLQLEPGAPRLLVPLADAALHAYAQPESRGAPSEGGLGAAAPRSGARLVRSYRAPWEDFALRSLRVLLAPELVTLDGRWEYRTLMAPHPRAVDPRVEVYPRMPGLPSGPYLLEPHPSTGHLFRVYYRGVHAFLDGRSHVVELDPPGEVRSLNRIAGVRTHRRRAIRPVRKAGERDPFLEDEALPVTEVVLTEWIDDVRFLSEGEAREVLWIPPPVRTLDDSAPVAVRP